MSSIQTIILAGGLGGRLHPLVDASHPKSLLGVANRPLLQYSLEMVQRAGLTDVIVVAGASHRREVMHFVKEISSVGSSVELVFLEGDDEGCGSADVLRLIRDRIKTTFIVLSADLITDLPLHHMIDLHRSKDAAVTSLVFEMPKGEDGKKSKADPGTLEYIGLDPNRTRLLYLVAAADLNEKLQLRSSLLNAFPVVNIHTNLVSAHMYIFNKWVIDLIAEHKHITTIQGELMPYLVKCQAASFSKSRRYDASQFIQPSPLKLADDLSTTSRPKEPVVCCVYYYDAGYSARANTVQSYGELNRQICKGACPPFTPTDRVHKTAEISSKTQVGNDSMVGEGSRVGDRCSVKKSVIGKHCTIGKNVKIVNSVLMDHITIQDNCKLEGVIVCSNAYIQENAALKDCEVGYSFTVPKDANLKNEKLTNDRSQIK